MAKAKTKSRIVRVLLGATIFSTSTILSGGVAQAADPSQIGGVAWNDTNADGLRDPGEPGLAGVNITLHDADTGVEVAGPLATAADGSYLFSALAAGNYQARAVAPTNRLVSSATTDNGFTPDGGGAPAPTGTSASIAIAAMDSDVALNLGVRPRPELSLGTFGPGVLDGASPFNTSGACLSAVPSPTPTGSPEWADSALPGQTPGDDCGSQNGVVRSQESIATIWSITADNYEPGFSALQNVIFEQTIHTAGGASAEFERIPVSCLAPPAGSGGTTPASTVTYDDPNPGDVKLVCNLGAFPEGFQESLTTFIRVSGESSDGSSVSSEQRVYSQDSNGVENAVPDDSPAIGPVRVSAAPAYDVAKDTIGILNYGPRSIDMAFDDHLPSCATNPQPCDIGTEPGLYGYFLVSLAADAESGVEALQQPITLDDNFFATTSTPATGTPYDFDFEITHCQPNTSGWSRAVYGRRTTSSSWTSAWVEDSGTCTPTRADVSDPTSAYDLVLNGVDMSGANYPTRTYGGSDLTAGPFYVAMHRVQFFIPNRTIDAADGVIDGVGAIGVSNCIDNFDPLSASGNSNYGTGTEPGYNRTEMPDGTGSNNCAGPTTFELRTLGGFSKYNYGYIGTNGYPYQVNGNRNRSGSHTYEPTQTFVGHVWNYNRGTSDLFDPVSCDVFDNTSLLLASAESVGQSNWTPPYLPAGSYAYINNGYSWNANNDPADFVVEYASADFGTDDPTSGGFNATTGRFEGDWSVARTFRCDDNATALVEGITYGLATPNAGADSDGDGWTTDPTAFANGMHDVNMVRARLRSETIPLAPGDRLPLVVPLALRDTFSGGPHDGDLIETGTVAPNFAGARWSHYAPGVWTNRSYEPSPQRIAGDGDRVTFTRAQLRIMERSVTPPADFGQTGSTLAGSDVVWELVPTLSSSLDAPAAVEDVTVVQVLPAEVSYDAVCTAALAEGRLPTLVELDTPNPGETRLTWNLGSNIPNQPIPAFQVCTDSDPLAVNGTTVLAAVTINAPSVAYNPITQADEHTVILEQSGSVQLLKSVDVTLDDQNDDQVYTLEWTNFAPAFPIINPTIIDVFAYNGDGVGSPSARAPESNFSGDYRLDGEPTTVFSDGSVPGVGDPFAAIGVWSYSADAPGTIDINPDANTSTWCLETQFGTVGCPSSFEDATALKFVSNYPLDRDGFPRQGVRATYTMNAGDDSPTPDPTRVNEPGDRYTNRFALDTLSLEASQFLRSNAVSVEVAAYSLGDLLFSDVNADGDYDELTESPLPDGVLVELRSGDDDSLMQSMTTASGDGTLGAGRYLFTLLEAGDYYVALPSSNFGVGGPLRGWSPTLVGPGVEPDNDDNEGVDQHGYSPGIVTANGIRTALITLSATPPLPGERPSGHEPTGDNTGGLADFTSDDFSNLTLDVGLVGPAQISIEKEICNQEPVSDCDEADESHWQEVFEVDIFADARWRITVSNPGSQLVRNASVSDLLASDCVASYVATTGLAELFPGDSVRYTCDSTELTVGFINTARVDATGALGQALSDSDTAAVTLATSEPEIVVEKATNTQDADAAPGVYVPVGDAVEWTYVVTNPGNMPLTNVRLVDDNGTPTNLVDDRAMGASGSNFVGGDSDGDLRLDVGETWRFRMTGTAVVGQYTNNAEVFGTPVVPGLARVSDTDPSNYFGVNNIAIEVEKATNAADASAPTTEEDADATAGPVVVAGEQVVWTYQVTTTGQALPLHNITLIDDAGTPATGGDDFAPTFLSGDDGDDLLEPGEVWLYQAVGVASAMDYENVARVTGIAPSTTSVNGTESAGASASDDDLSHYQGASPSVVVIKEVNGQDANAEPGATIEAGETASFTYQVTNNGDIALMNLVVDDDRGVVVLCPQTALAPGASMTCSGSQIAVTGQYTNIGTVSGTPAVAGPDAGTPWVALTNNDGSTPDQVTDNDPANYFGVESGITINKQVNGTESASLPGVAIVPGDTASFTYEVTNTGDAVLMDVIVTDDQGVAVSCPETVLAPDESMTCTGSSIAIAGQYTNIGSVIGTPAGPGPDAATPWQPLVNGDGTSPDKPTAQDIANYHGLLPGVDITKYVNGHDANDAPGVTLPTGADVVWTYVVTNTGNTVLTDVSVTDDQGVEVTCPETALAANASMTCVGSGHVVAGPYVNVGLATGQPAALDPSGEPVPLEWSDGTLVDPVTDSDPANNFGFSNGITIRKDVFGFDAPADDPVFTRAGTVAPFTYLVTNTGNTWLDGLSVTDDQGVIVTCPESLLAPGASMTCEGSGEIPIGNYTNIGTVAGVPSIETVMGLVPVTDPDTGVNIPELVAEDDANVFGEHAEIELTKVACYQGDCGQGSSVPADATLTWRIEVTNVGNVALRNVQIVDDKVSACDQVLESLAVGETVLIECEAKVSVTRSNTAEATATPVTQSTPETTGTVGSVSSTPRRSEDTATVQVKRQTNLVLAYTGASTAKQVGAGLALSLVGTAMLGVSRRRREQSA